MANWIYTPGTYTPLNVEMETSPAKTKMKGRPKKQARSRPLPPDVNSRNLAIEKRRRKDMNRIFLDLADCVPRPASNKRLSKRLIVIESLQQLRLQRDTCIAAGRELRELLSTHNDLITEVNMLRSQLGITIMNALRVPSTAFLQLMDVENQASSACSEGLPSPSEMETCELQLSAEQSESHISLPGPVVQAYPESSTQFCAQEYLPVNNRTCDVIGAEDWQGQISGHPFLPSNAEGDFAPDIDCWGLSVPGMTPSFSWEDPATHVMPQDDAHSDLQWAYSEIPL